MATNNLGTGVPGDAQSIPSAWILLSGLLTDPHNPGIALAMNSGSAAASEQAAIDKAKLHDLLLECAQIEERPRINFQMIALIWK